MNKNEFNTRIFDLSHGYNIKDRIENAKATIDLAKNFTCFGTVDPDMYDDACNMLSTIHPNGLIAAALSGSTSANEIIDHVEVRLNCDLQPGEMPVSVKYPLVEEFVDRHYDLENAEVTAMKVTVSDGRNTWEMDVPVGDDESRLRQYNGMSNEGYENECRKHAVWLLHMFAHGGASQYLMKSHYTMSRYGLGFDFVEEIEKIPTGTLYITGVDNSEVKHTFEIFDEMGDFEKHVTLDGLDIHQVYLPARLVRASGHFGRSSMLIDDHWTDGHAKQEMIVDLCEHGVDYGSRRGDSCDVIYGVASACVLRKK